MLTEDIPYPIDIVWCWEYLCSIWMGMSKYRMNWIIHEN